MKEEIYNYLETFSKETKLRFRQLYDLIYENTPFTLEEKLWAKLPSFYNNGNFIRIIPFKDHINIEARAAVLFKEELSGYKFTPKGMLQIFHSQPVPENSLIAIINKSLS